MKHLLVLPAFLIALLLPAFGQTPPVTKIDASKTDAAKIDGKIDAATIDNDFVHKQFGDQFTMLTNVEPTVGDLDGDGIEDVVIAARCKNPMLDQGDHNYTVMDPYNDFFGYGDPRMTTTFSEGDPAQRGLVVLIIYGAGKEGWRAPAPKAKFVIVNLPYRALSVRKMRLRKKTIQAVYVEEAGDFEGSSALFFDGKKFRYVPMGGDMQ
jgi:hypothetical protein